jgi:hypothetical protein
MELIPFVTRDRDGPPTKYERAVSESAPAPPPLSLIGVDDGATMRKRWRNNGTAFRSSGGAPAKKKPRVFTRGFVRCVSRFGACYQNL